MRAVYDTGESEDSNMLLVASLNHHLRDELSTSTSTGTQNEVLSLPRLFQPPVPTQVPEIVQRSSTLSKSESCLTLGAISVNNSTALGSRSVSDNQLAAVLDQKTDPPTVLQPIVSQANPSVNKTVTLKQIGVTVNDPELIRPVTHKENMHTQPQLITSDANSSDVLLRQEIGHELSRRYDQVDQQSHAAHNPSSTMPSFLQTTRSLDPAELGQATCELQHEQEQSITGSNFTAEEASSVTPEADQSSSIKQQYIQTQPPLSSSDKNGLKTGTLHTVVASNSHSTIPAESVLVKSPHHSKAKVVPDSSDVARRHAAESSDATYKHVRTLSPVNQRSPRLAAVFVHSQPSASTFSQENQCSRPFVDSTHTTQLYSFTHQCDPASAACPLLQLNKSSVLIGSTHSAEHAGTNGHFSGKDQNEEGFTGKDMAGKHMPGKVVMSSSTNSQDHFQGREFGHSGSQLPLAAAGNVAHLSSSTCQQSLEKNLNKCQASLLPACVSSATMGGYIGSSATRTESQSQTHSQD